MIFRKKIVVIHMLLLSLFVFSVTAGVKNTPNESKLRLRAKIFWSDLSTGKLDRCYGMLTKKSRSQFTMVDYIRRNNVHVKSFEIKSVSVCRENKKHGRVQVVYSVSTPFGYSFRHIKMLQNWFFENGDWYVEYIVRTPFDGANKFSDRNGTNKKLDEKTRKKIEAIIKKLRTEKKIPKPAKNQIMQNLTKKDEKEKK